ncbi:MAG: hypothetical protein JWP57_704 [Spirosoma sp.]|nr:hypothetical protein [Spirosoma sp.]
MKKYVLTAIMGVFFCIGLTSMVNLSPPPNKQCRQICADPRMANSFSSTGSCVSYCNVCSNPSESAASTAVCFCKYIANVGDDNKFGECVNIVKGSNP